MAGTMNTITMIFDSHIQSVSDDSNTNTWTSSGQTIDFWYGSGVNCVVALDSGYELDTVSTTVGTATIGEDKKSFIVNGIPDATVTITLTSKPIGAIL